MAKVIYPFAQIVQGDFAGMYVFYQANDGKYFIRTDSVYKDGFFSSGLGHHARYEYQLNDIIGYEELGSATHTADAASVLLGGIAFGVVGAMTASAAGTGTTYDTQIYFKDRTKCVFRFFDSQVHQNYITSFHQLNIKPGDPFVALQSEQEKKAAKKLLQIKQAGFIVDALDVDTDAFYDIYCASLKEEFCDRQSWLLQNILTEDARHLNLSSEADNIQNIEDLKARGYMLFARNIFGSLAKEALIYKSKAADFALVKAGTPNPFENPVVTESKPKEISQPEKTSKPASYIEELKELKSLVDIGVISQEEFETKKRQLLGL